MKIPPKTARHNVGTCPACRDFLWADVEIEVSVSEPTMTREGSVIVNVSPSIVGMAVAHSCWTDESGERQIRNTEELGDLGDIAEAKRDAVRSAAKMFRDMTMGIVDRSEIVALLQLRAESYCRTTEPEESA